MAHGLTRPRKLLQFDPTQPRKSFDEEELERLGDDQVEHGTLVPLLIGKPDSTTGISIIYDGERRVRGGDKKGITEYPVVEISGPISDKEKLGLQLRTVFHRTDLSGHERWAAVAQLVASGGMQQKEVAKFLNVTEKTVSIVLTPSKCSPEWQEALKNGLVSLSDCAAASKLSPEEQGGLLKLKLSGASRDDLEQVVKKAKNGKHKENSQSDDKVKRIKFVVPSSGVNVLVSGKGVTLDGSISALKEAVKELERARDLGLTAKTFGQATKDMRAKKDKETKENEKKGGGDGQPAPAQ